MKSIPLALTWEFWRQLGFAFLAVVGILSGLMVVLYGGLRADRLYDYEAATFTSLHMFCFVFVVVGLAAAICHSTSSPQYRFALPVSMRVSILVPMVNGAFAMTIGYLAISLFVNWRFNAQWSLLKPAILAVCMVSVCQAVGWIIGASSTLRSAIVAGVCTALGVGVFLLNGADDPDVYSSDWYKMRPLDISLAIYVPISAYIFSLVVLTLARRGQVFSISAIGRWLLAKLDLRFSVSTPGATAMAAELWMDWKARGRLTSACPMLIATAMCGFFLSGRFEWESARVAIIAFTWVQVMIGPILGLYIGQVGERFDFHEYSATRPLADAQLADVKLLNTLKSVCWMWTTWTFGVATAIVCLTLVGQGPNGWRDVVPPEAFRLPVLLGLLMIPLGSWTLTSLGVSIVILRPWMVKTVLCILAILPFVPYALPYLLPVSDTEAFVAFQWGWIFLTIGGTIALYVTAFRLRLITIKRITIVSSAYLLPVAAWLLFANFMPPLNVPCGLAFGFLLSNCTLPFICIAAVPVAVWWNRHR